MVKALFDTNILIDYLQGISSAQVELGSYTDKAISTITWMEVIVGATAENEQIIRRFLASFAVISVNEEISELAVSIRRRQKIRLPDAIILATASFEKRILVTRNTRDFDASSPGIRIPYHLIA